MHIIDSFRSSPEDLEVRWITEWFDSDHGQKIKVVTRGLSSGNLRFDDLSIGWLPAFAPGRVISDGQILNTPVSATILQLEIPDLSRATDKDAAEAVPKQLYSFGGHWGWGQRVLSYSYAGTTCLIPATELIRFLFLHNSTMANHMLHPVGLPKLAITPNPGQVSDLRIDFTHDMPLRSLDSSFAREFAWLAVDPEGRKSWDSIRRLSFDKRYLTLRPPPIPSVITFRGVRWNSTYLVLEILKATGRRLPCKSLDYTHPSLQQIKLEQADKPPPMVAGEVKPMEAKQHIVLSNAAPRRDIRQDSITLSREYGTFDNDIIVRKITRPIERPKPEFPEEEPEEIPDIDGAMAATPRRGQNGGQAVVRSVASSVDESDPTGELRPLELKLLEAAPWEYGGETKALASVIRTIAEHYPSMRVGLSLCYLKSGRAFSMTSRARRTCLIGTFWQSNRPLTVVLDVDHSGLTGLSGLLLRYKVKAKLIDIEAHARLLLDGLVDNGGIWNTDMEDALSDKLLCQRLPRMMRKQGNRTTRYFVKVWANKLLEKIRGEEVDERHL